MKPYSTTNLPLIIREMDRLWETAELGSRTFSETRPSKSPLWGWVAEELKAERENG